MKKLILTAGLTVASLAAFGQGQILVGNGFTGSGNFVQPIFGVNSNTPNTSVSGNPTGYGGILPAGGTTSYAGSSLLQGAAYDFGFYAGAATDTSISQMALVTVLPFRTATSDKLPAGLVTQAQATVPGVQPGTDCTFVIAAWWTGTAGQDVTYAEAAADPLGQFGKTGVITSAQLAGTDSNGNVFATTPDANGWNSFSLMTVTPEPGTLALLGIGAAGLLFFRRRK
jgi:hypothetical protein